MTPAAASLDRWAPRQWTLVIIGIVLLQVAVALLLSQRQMPAPPPRAAGLTVQFINGAAAEPGPGALGADPAMFALMNPYGFSGRVWQDYRLFQHSLNDWQEPPQWLGPEGVRLGAEFQRFAARSDAGLWRGGDRPAPRAAAPGVSGVGTVAKSSLLIGRELAHRPLQADPTLPALSNPEVLSDTVAQVIVNAAGDVLSARVLAGSGSPVADERALALARGLRFAPLPPGQFEAGNPWSRLVTGTLTFRWFTRETGAGTSP